MKPLSVITRLNKAAIAASLLLVGGCVSPLSPAIVAVPSAQPFMLLGKAVIRRQQKTERFNFVWQRTSSPNGVTDTVWVKDRIGTTRARLKNAPNGAVLKMAKKTWRDNNAETLSRRLLGFTLPMQAMGFWLGGETDPSSEATIKDDFIEQVGWEINYKSYFDDGFPKRIKFFFADGNAVLLIQEWHQHP